MNRSRFSEEQVAYALRKGRGHGGWRGLSAARHQRGLRRPFGVEVKGVQRGLYVYRRAANNRLRGSLPARYQNA